MENIKFRADIAGGVEALKSLVPAGQQKIVKEEALLELRKITTEATACIRKKMLAVDPETGLTFYETFVNRYLDDALRDPSGKCGQTLASGLFNEKTMQMLDASVDEAMAKQTDFAIYRLRQTLYKEQQDVFDDDVDPKIIVICSRRAGKTEMIARKIAKVCLKPNSPCLYLNKTFANAINQLFDLLLEQTGVAGLVIKSKSKAEGLIEFSNGSSVKFGGVNDIAAVDKYRGFKFRLSVVDEIGHIKNGRYLIDEVLSPALSDYSDSQMLFAGTPPRVKNYAVELWNSKIRKFHWTAEVNPFIPDFRSYIDRICEEKGLTLDDPFIQREYFGNMEAWDSEAVVFKGYKTYSGKHTDDRNFHADRAFVGIDWGFVDHFAVVTFLFDSIRKKAYVVDVFAAGGVGAEDKKAIIQKKYLQAGDLLSNYGYDIGRVRLVCDTNQPDVAYDLYKLGLPVDKAYKVDMMNDVENLAARLRTGAVVVSSEWTEDNNELVADLNRTVYYRDDDTDELQNEIDDSVWHPNAVHALRYAVRLAFEGLSGGSAGSISPSDTTVTPGLENIKETGKLSDDINLPPWMRKNANVTESFVV